MWSSDDIKSLQRNQNAELYLFNAENFVTSQSLAATPSSKIKK